MLNKRKHYEILLYNKSKHSYYIPNDKIILKVDIRRKNSPLFIKDLPINLFFYINNEWQLFGEFVTTSQGSTYITVNTNDLPTIHNCLSKVVIDIDGEQFTSTPVRINFINTIPYELRGLYLIDSGTNDVNLRDDLDRTNYTIYDSENRNTYYLIDSSKRI